MDPQPTPKPVAAPPRKQFPLSAVIVVGIAAIIAGIVLRNSSWAQERRLRSLSLEDISLVAHDDPKDALALFYYGTALLSANRTLEAETAFAMAIKQDPSSERAQRGLANAELKLDKLPQAVEAFQKAIKLNPKNGAAYLGLAQTLSRQGDSQQAAQQMKRAVDLDPDNAAAWYSLSKMYTDINNSDGALDSLKHAVKLNPHEGVYWMDLGELSLRNSKFDEAEQYLKTAVQLSPGSGIASLRLGQLYFQMGDTPGLRLDAEKAFETAVAADPRIEEAYVGLGIEHQRSAEYQAAMNAFRKANKLDPSDEKVVKGLGECLVRTGNIEEGNRLLAAAAQQEALQKQVNTLRSRLASEPQSREVRLELAHMFRQHGNYAEALTQYAAYQNLGAEDPVVRKEMEKCREQQNRYAGAGQATSIINEPADNAHQ